MTTRKRKTSKAAPPVPTKSEIDLALEQFKHEWLALPPLVRASLGVYAAETSVRASREDQRYADAIRSVGLERRAVVCERFSRGRMALGALFIKLTSQADAEAAARGIDADIEPTLLAGEKE